MCAENGTPVACRLITDQLGSVRVVVNADGTLVGKIDYDAWGNVTKDTTAGFQPFGFAGGMWDADTGFVHFGVREYDPETGRWLSRDPIGFAGGDTNLYAYVFDDPINYIDPEGKIAPALVILGFGLAGGIGSALGTVFVEWHSGVSGWDVAKSFAGGFIGGAIGGALPVGPGAVSIGRAAFAGLFTAIGGNISAIVDIFGGGTCSAPSGGTGGQGGAGPGGP